jgi:hypothetical protein
MIDDDTNNTNYVLSRKPLERRPFNAPKLPIGWADPWAGKESKLLDLDDAIHDLMSTLVYREVRIPKNLQMECSRLLNGTAAFCPDPQSARERVQWYLDEYVDATMCIDKLRKSITTINDWGGPRIKLDIDIPEREGD